MTRNKQFVRFNNEILKLVDTYIHTELLHGLNKKNNDNSDSNSHNSLKFEAPSQQCFGLEETKLSTQNAQNEQLNVDNLYIDPNPNPDPDIVRSVDIDMDGLQLHWIRDPFTGLIIPPTNTKRPIRPINPIGNPDSTGNTDSDTGQNTGPGLSPGMNMKTKCEAKCPLLRSYCGLKFGNEVISGGDSIEAVLEKEVGCVNWMCCVYMVCCIYVCIYIYVCDYTI